MIDTIIFYEEKAHVKQLKDMYFGRLLDMVNAG